MASVVKRTLVLTGARKGLTCLLSKMYQFINGKIVLEGPAHDVEALTHWMKVNYAAYPEGHAKVEETDGERVVETAPDPGPTEEVLSGVQSGGEGPPEVPSDNGEGPDEAAPDRAPDLPEGDGHEDSRVHRIEQALNALDVTNDEHWTNQGKPSVDAVSIILDEKVTRAQIDLAAPDFTR